MDRVKELPLLLVLERLLQLLQPAHGNIRLHFSPPAHDIELAMTLGMALGLLVSELVSNAIHHAFASGLGDIYLDLQQQDGETCLQGIVSLGDRMVRFLDLERVLPGRPGDEG